MDSRRSGNLAFAKPYWLQKTQIPIILWGISTLGDAASFIGPFLQWNPEEILNFYSLLCKKHFSWSCKAPEAAKARVEDIPGVPMENKRLKIATNGSFYSNSCTILILAKPASRGAGGTSYSLSKELHFQSGQMHEPGGQGRRWWWCSDCWKSRFSIFMIYWYCSLNATFYYSRKSVVSIKLQVKAWLSIAFWIFSFIA